MRYVVNISPTPQTLMVDGNKVEVEPRQSIKVQDEVKIEINHEFLVVVNLQ